MLAFRYDLRSQKVQYCTMADGQRPLGKVAYFTLLLRPLGHGAGARRRSPAAKDERKLIRENRSFF